MTPNPHRITREKFDAVLFDLDGVLTATAKLHASSWKVMFDGFLERRDANLGEPFRPFDIDADYRQFVDGKPRIDGVRDFLRSRGIEMPDGIPDEAPGDETLHGLGNQKNVLVNEMMRSKGVEAFPDGVEVVRRGRDLGLKSAVVSSSHNCEAVLEAAGIVDLFELWVDGNIADALRLPGKPAPDTFLKAAERLAVDPERAVVVEDAISGVQAGRAGGFGLVVGVDRGGDPEALKNNGADVVVTDLRDLLP
jgi:beta-phosphoglucomutase family hydrolase